MKIELLKVFGTSFIGERQIEGFTGFFVTKGVEVVFLNVRFSSELTSKGKWFFLKFDNQIGAIYFYLEKFEF